VSQGEVAAARSRLEARLDAGALTQLLVLAAKTVIADGRLSKGEELLRRVIDSDPSILTRTR
jgi:hypothetical protein